MLRLLSSRELGIDQPSHLKTAEKTRRAFSAELSKYQDVQQIFDSAINSLDLDLVEHRYMLSGAANGNVAIHDLRNLTGTPQFTYPTVCTVGRGNPDRHKMSIETVSWYPLDTGMFLTSGMDSLLKVWDTNRLRVADQFELNSHIYCHDLSRIATTHSLVSIGAQSNKVRLVDLKTGAAVHTLRGHKQSVVTTKWSTKDEFIVATGSMDNKVMLWDIRSAKGCLMTLDQHNGKPCSNTEQVNTAHNGAVSGLCFTADGIHLLTLGTDQRMRVWNTSSGKNTLVNFGKISNKNKKGVKFAVSCDTNPDVVFVPSDTNVEMFLMNTGEKIGTLRGHYNRVNCCLFHPHSQELFSGGNDRCILTWIPETESVLSYSRHLSESNPKDTSKRTNFVQRIGATLDNWSSDED